jgi:streptogramin lyase
LREGNSFLVSLERTFTIPIEPLELSFTYADLSFDTRDPDSINDAFEVAFVDVQGRTLAHTFVTDRDAYFNATEDEPIALGTKAVQNGQTVTLDISSLTAGTTGTVVFRLVNNDSDTLTAVKIHCVQITGGDLAPQVAVVLENDTAPPGPAGDPFRTDRLTNDPVVRGSASDDESVALLEVRVDGGTFQDITSSLAGGLYRFDPGVLAIGAHRIVVRATDNVGQISEQALDFRVNAPPTAEAGVDRTVDAGAPVLFDGSASTDAEAPLFSYRWTFHDGTTADGPMATRTYDQAGTFPVMLTVTDTAGSTHSETIQVTVRSSVRELTPVFTKDDGEFGYRERGIWTRVNAPAGWKGDYRTQTPGTGTRTASWTLRGAPGYYELFATWFGDPAHAADAPFTIADSSTPRGSVRVNMQQGPSDGRYDNRLWGSLGIYEIATGVAVVELSDAAGGLVMADGVILVPATPKFYVADAGANSAFRYAASGTGIGSFALTGGSATPSGIAGNAAGDTLWVIDRTTHQVDVYNADGSVRGSWQALGLQNPQDIATDGTDIWIVDAGLGQVLRYAGAASLLGGDAMPEPVVPLLPENISPTGLVQAGSTFWVTDDSTDEVFVYDAIDGPLSRWSLDAANADASGLTRNPAGGEDLWVVDRVDKLVYRYIGAMGWHSGSQPAADTFALAAGNSMPEGIADPPPQSGAGDSLLDANGTVTFTTTADFNVGMLFNVNATDAPDELRIDPPPLETYPFIWVSNSGEGTVSRFDTRTGRELGRYCTGPSGAAHSPSRTAVDGDGNAWIANRAFGIQGTVIKVLRTGFIDRNGNGLIDTSRDLNNDGQITGSELLPWDANGDGQPDDERIALVVNAGRDRTNPNILVNNGVPRSLAIDADDNIWVGLFNLRQYEVYDGRTGAYLATVPVAGQPYGAVIDANGHLFSATRTSYLDRINTNTRTYVGAINHGGDNYGIGLGQDGVVWTTTYSSGQLIRYDPATNTVRTYSVPGIGAYRGVGVDLAGNVWAASNSPDALVKFTFAADGTTLLNTRTVATGNTPSAAVIDSEGFVWTTSYGYGDRRAWKVDPNTVTVVPGWPIQTGIEPYNYSDMTGQVRVSVTNRTGTWTEIIDSQRSGTPWGSAGLTSIVPPSTTVRLRIRASDNRDQLEAVSFVELPAGANPQGVKGRYLEVEVTLQAEGTEVSPSVLEVAIAALAPPSIVVQTPADGASLPAGQTILISGQALAARTQLLNLPPAANSIRLVTSNDVPVDALDALGNFFTRVLIKPGQNVFTFRTMDAYGQTGMTTLTLEGVQLPAGDIDFSLFADVSSSMAGEYGRTSFDQARTFLYADLAVRNTGQYPMDAPLFVGVTNISDPTVRLRNPDGVTPEGIPYYDFTALVAGGRLLPGALSGERALEFFNPNCIPFTYDLVFLARLNQAPVISTVPDVEALVGRPYVYDADATDPDGDPVTFALTTNPPTMQIDPMTGRITWTAAAADVGSQVVTVRVEDGRGGFAEQRYALAVIQPPPNRPPVFTSVPIVTANVNTDYRYPAMAADPDGDSLTFSLGTTMTTAVPINNPGFEAQVLGDGGFLTTTLTGWTLSVPSQSGPYNPPAGAYPGGVVPEGQNVAYSNGGTISQVLTQALVAGTRYTLTVRVGDRLDAAFPGYRVQLLAGGTLLAEETAQTPANGTFATSTVDYDSMANDPRAGLPLEIRLVSNGIQVNFDDVRLTAETTVGIVPGMAIDANTGVATWRPTAAQIGTHDVALTVSDGRGGTAAQTYTILVQPDPVIPPPAYDLTVVTVDPSALEYDGQTLTVSGDVSATIKNQGTSDLFDPFEVLFFEDFDFDQAYNPAVDRTLGRILVATTLRAGQSTVVTTELAGSVLFAENVVWAFVDSTNVISETDEANNQTPSGADCIFAPPVGTFDPILEWSWTSSPDQPDSLNVTMTPAIIDLNGDRVPDIVFGSTADRDGRLVHVGVLRALSGNNGAELFTVTDPGFLINTATSLAVGDIDLDGKPEIVASDSSGVRLIAFEHDGTFKWRSPVLEATNWGAVALADLDADGTPEIVIGRQVLNNNGTLRWSGTGGRAEQIFAGNLPLGSLSLVADVNLDGTPEVVAGNTVYSATGAIVWQAPFLDGYNQPFQHEFSASSSRRAVERCLCFLS